MGPESFRPQFLYAADGPPGGPPGPDQEPGGDEERAQYEMSVGRVRPPDLREFAEQLEPGVVREYAHNLVQVWLERYVRYGEAPNKYQLDDVAVRAGSRLKILRKLMDRPGYHFMPEEVAAGLKPGFHRNEVPVEIQEDPSVDIVEREGRFYWVRKGTNGKEDVLGLFMTDAPMVQKLDKLNKLQYGRAWLQNDEGKAVDYKFDAKGFRARYFIGSVVAPDSAKEKREGLAKEVEQQLHHIESWSNILTKTSEQDIFATDLDNYVEKQFLRVGKTIARTRHYAEIFNAPATREGFKPFGEKITAAYEAWREIAEGRAIATVGIADPESPDGTRRVSFVLPNLFAYSQNQGLRDLCMTYVQNRVVKEKPSDIQNPTDEVKVEEDEDNRAAAMAAYIFMDHWDHDAASAIDVLRREDQGNFVVDAAVIEGAISDLFKLAHPTARRYNEFFGFTTIKEKTRRPHPRVAGAPVTLKALPHLTSSFPESVTVDVLATNKATGKKDIIPVTIDQRAFGAVDNEGNRVLKKDEATGKQFTEITRAKNSGSKGETDKWVFEVTGLQDRRMWDSAQVVVKTDDDLLWFPLDAIKEMKVDAKKNPSKEERKLLQANKMRAALGASTNAQEIPYGLLNYYALTGVFNEFIRVDFLDQFNEYADADADYAKLRTLNKRVELGTKVLRTQHQLSDDTISQLEEFLRISLIAGACASIIKYEQKGDKTATVGREPEQQPPLHPQLTKAYEGVTEQMERAAFAARFVRTKTLDDKGNLGWQEPNDSKLFKHIITNRGKGPMSPWDVKFYFTESQLQELKPLYSFLFQE